MALTPTQSTTWQAHPAIWWGAIAPAEHLVQFYESDGVLLNSLECFVASGIEADEGVVVIATTAHRHALAERLALGGIGSAVAIARGQYLALDAEEVLAEFMVDGWPDQELFERFVTVQIARMRADQLRPVRAFSGLAACLWGQHLSGAAVRLEHLCHRLCYREGFSLFCAYPRSGFTERAEASIRGICDAHSRVLAS